VETRSLAWFNENKHGAGNAWSRLPPRAEKSVRPPVWELGQSPSSAHLAFRSDTTRFAVRAKNIGLNPMQHMTGLGNRGLQLYSGSPMNMRPLATATPDPDSETYERLLFEGLTPKMREFRLYLPLYSPLETLEIALDKGAKLLAPAPLRLAKPVVWYGTSITQGGCASTPGHDFVSTVGRRMNLETINLGFSGNGKGEPEMAKLLAEIDASLYVLDYAANVDATTMRKTLPRFVDILRAARPEVPILIQTIVCFSQYGTGDVRWRELEDQRDAMIELYAARRKRGDLGLHLVDGFALLPFGVDSAYVDGGHPTDFGFALMAERLVPVIERILFREG